MTMVMNDEVLVQEYDDMTSDDQDLYDQITEMFGEKWTHEQTLNFMGELDDYGITQRDQLEDAFMYVTDTQYTPDGAKAEFAEYWFTDVMCNNTYDDVVVDWTATFDYALRFDMNVIEFDGDFYFFNNNF